MALVCGARLGPYEIVALLGAGGMGEVYRARDTKLDRDVAIKVLPEVFVADPERLARFEREARMLASLNHPHIGAIYGFEEADGVRGLVLELVEGQTLAERIQRGSLPIAEALAVARQIADALDAAHEKGIVHRDLKPANIKITGDGAVKVLDFGLAKAAVGAASTPGLSQSPTVTIGGTREGVILGTAAYMSPEQARGQVVDKRTDIWAFGCVLYEMLTGRAAFACNTLTDTLAAIVQREPDWTALRSVMPPTIKRLLQRSLEKDAGRRLRDIADARLEIDEVLARTRPGATDRRPWSRRMLPWALGLLAASAATASTVFFLHGRLSSPASSLEMHQVTAFTDFATQPSLSADGRMLAFIRGPGSFITAGQVYVKLLPDGEPVQLTHDPMSKIMPVFSPDGSRIAYGVVTPNGSWDTWIVPVLGGEARLWLPNASGLRWTGSRRLLFSEIKDGIHMALVTATESRTESRDVYVPESIRGMVHRSYLSPDGAWVIVTEMDNGGMLPCRVVPFDGRSAGRVVGPSSGQCTHAAWAPDGRVMYFTSNAAGSFQIWRQRFPDGRPEQLTFGPTEAEGLAMSPDARSAVTSIGFDQGSVGISESGTERQVSTEGSALLPAWGDGFPTSVFSPDGKKLYYLVRTGVSRGFGSGELWVCDLATGSHERLLPGISITSYDISADGQRIVFSSFDADGTSHIWLARLDRRAPPAKLPPVEARGPVFGPENDVYFRGLEGKLWYLYEIKLDSGQIRKFTAEQAVNSPTISPDGKWILSLVPTAGLDATTVVKAFPTKGGAPVSVCTSCSLKWTRDQKHLFFSFGFSNGEQDGMTFVIALSPGKALPDLPSGGLASEAQARKLPIVRAINRMGLFPGPTASVYAFQQRSVQRNLYRLAIPQ